MASGLGGIVGRHGCIGRFYKSNVKTTVLSKIKCTVFNISKRQYSDSEKTNRPASPFIFFGSTPFSGVSILPSIFSLIRNPLKCQLITSRYDPDFSKETFLQGAEQAVITVSSLISQGKYEDLKDLVDDKTLSDIKQSHGIFPNKYRDRLKVCDMGVTYLKTVDVIFDDTDKKRVAVAEIAAVFFYVSSQRENFNLNDTCVCCYRFTRDYIVGQEDSWTINKLNHIMWA